ncbi:MAG: hydantoinase B/oxoprolinase family protein [Pseudomonadota bacterium]
MNARSESDQQRREETWRQRDPATFQVVKNALYAVAEEMKVVLAKTAYSPILKVAGDYSCGVFDVHGEMVAQGPDLPIHLGSMPDAVKALIAAHDAIHPEDVFIHNDPYFGGTHLPDVNVVTPAFSDGDLLGFACVRAHWPDVGSATPGSYGAVTEIFGEGLRLPPVRLYSRGELNEDVANIVFCNVRAPEDRRGDLSAQVAANLRAVQRLSALAGKHGTGKLKAIMAEVMDYSEDMMRAMLAELPDGESTFEELCDGDGILTDDGVEEPFKVRLAIVKRKDGLAVDFTGSDPQVPGPMNAPLAVTASGIYTAVKMVADPTNLIPPNSGCWRPVSVTAPTASVVNCVMPAPVVYANHEMSHRVCDMFFGAFAHLAPDNVMTCSQGTSAILTLGGTDYRNGATYVSYESLKGGFGARPNKDGISGLSSGIANTMNTPVEILEMSFPFRVERYELIADSGGAGQHRGGLGVRRTWRLLGNDARASVCCERTLTPPFGLFGGHAGKPARITLTTPDGTTQVLNSKGPFTAPADARIDYVVPGAGGYGDPLMRNRHQIRDDVRNGYVSPTAASDLYGLDETDL